jgi:hypothetical protein
MVASRRDAAYLSQCPMATPRTSTDYHTVVRCSADTDLVLHWQCTQHASCTHLNVRKYTGVRRDAGDGSSALKPRMLVTLARWCTTQLTRRALDASTAAYTSRPGDVCQQMPHAGGITL